MSQPIDLVEAFCILDDSSVAKKSLWAHQYGRPLLAELEAARAEIVRLTAELKDARENFAIAMRHSGI